MGAIDITSTYRDAVRRRRAALGLPTPSHEVLRRNASLSAFAAEASATLQAISMTASQMQELQEQYALDEDELNLTEAERDEVDAETQGLLAACGERLEALKQLAAAEAKLQQHERSSSGSGGARPSIPQQVEHRQALLKMLYERLGEVAGVFNEHRAERVRRAAKLRDQRLGSLAESAGLFAAGGPLGPGQDVDALMRWENPFDKLRVGGASGTGGSLVGGAVTGAVVGALGGAISAVGGVGRSGDTDGESSAGGAGGVGGANGADGIAGSSLPPMELEQIEWRDDEVFGDANLDEGTKAQLEVENETLQREMEGIADQAKAAEGRMLEISSTLHLFATKVEQQSKDVELIDQLTEATAENITRGNAHVDAASKHSRDFRLVVITILFVATFGLLFLDYYYP